VSFPNPLQGLPAWETNSRDEAGKGLEPVSGRSTVRDRQVSPVDGTPLVVTRSRGMLVSPGGAQCRALFRRPKEYGGGCIVERSGGLNHRVGF
jgi:hypothetical protein